MKTLKGTTAIVTGGGSGIGFAVAQALVNADANVIIVHSLCPALVQVPSPENDNEINDEVLQAEDLASTVMFLLTQPKRVKYDNIGLYRF